MRAAHVAITLALLGMGAPPLAAQSARDSVKATVQEFFRSMTARDSAAARRVLLEEDGSYWAVAQSPKGFFAERRTNAAYLANLGKPGPTLLERGWDPTILVHGSIATLWTPYDFHVDGKFSHCGVDAFTLVRSDTGWKIATVVYTIERDGCAPSPLGPPVP